MRFDSTKDKENMKRTNRSIFILMVISISIEILSPNLKKDNKAPMRSRGVALVKLVFGRKNR